MPSYDYRCSECNHAFEAMHSITADPLKTCPSCNQDKLVRQIGRGGGILFKGSGFYCNDYKAVPQEPKRKDEP